MADAKATICYLNGLSLRTINEVEKILRALPKKGDRCEMELSKAYIRDTARSTGDVIASNSMQIRDEPKPFCLSPQVEKIVEDVVVKQIENKPKKMSKNISDYSCISSNKQEEKLEVHTTSITGAGTTATTKKTGSKLQCKVLTDQVRVSPIVSCNGVILELDVEVTIPDREEKKKLNLEIECPDFVPSRMKIGNKWKKIV